MKFDYLFEIRPTYLRNIILDNYFLNNLLGICNIIVIPTKYILVKKFLQTLTSYMFRPLTRSSSGSQQKGQKLKDDAIIEVT